MIIVLGWIVLVYAAAFGVGLTAGCDAWSLVGYCYLGMMATYLGCVFLREWMGE
jgi:hypothetical protein